MRRSCCGVAGSVVWLWASTTFAVQAGDEHPTVALWSGGRLTIAGQHRLRYELTDPTGLGVGPAARKSSVLYSRNLLRVDANVSAAWRVYAELGGYYALGVAEHAEPPAADDADVAQLFVEALADVGGLRLRTRLGRQEMPLGSTRWMSVRDGANVRLAFDLVRFTLTDAATAGWKLDAFVGSVPRLRRGVLDDAPTANNELFGVYSAFDLLAPSRLVLDAFYIGRRRSNVSYEDVSGRELRHTVGARLAVQTAFGLELMEHALFQWGTIGQADVRAWGFATALWQVVPGTRGIAKLGVRGDALSGDHRPNDGTVTTFYPLFPNQTFFSGLSAIYPANLYDVHPIVRLKHDRWELEAGHAFFWRQAVQDAIFQPPGRATPAPRNNGARFTGGQSSVALGYVADRHWRFNAEYSHFGAGAGLVGAGGRDVDFFGTWTTYEY